MKIVLWICTVIIALASCKSVESDVKLTERKWVLESMDGEKPQLKVAHNRVTMQFNDTEKRVSGMAGCNRFFGGYEMDGKKLKFSHMGATRMTCPDIEVEMKFFKILEDTDNFQIKDHQLTLFQKNKVLAVFKGENTSEK